MNTEIKNGKVVTAENELFSWTSREEDYLTYKPTGQKIYQNVWYIWKNSTPITDAAIVTAKAEFWAGLEAAQKAEDAKWTSESVSTLPVKSDWQNSDGSLAEDC